MNRFLHILLLLSLTISSSSIYANNFDGSKPLVCAIVEVLDCGVRGDCEQVDPEFVNMPNIFKVNIKDKQAHSGERKSKIDHVSVKEHSTILHGISDDDKGWSMVLSHNTGKFTGAVAAYDYGFILFGSCVVDD